MEENDLTNKQFNKIISFVFLGILIFIAFLFLINLNLGFKVSGIVGDKNNIDIFQSSVKIAFKTPIDFGQNTQDLSEVPNLKELISIEPKVDFGINVTGTILTLSFKETLNSESTYKIVLNKNLTDIYGNNLKVDKQLEFKTRINAFSYIQRNYPDSNDKLVRTDVKFGKTEVIYEKQEDKIIDQFAQNHNYYALLIENADLTSNIKILNKENNNLVDLKLSNKKVKNVNLFKNSNKLIYVAHNVKFQDEFLIPDGYSKFYLYDINSKTSTELDFQDKLIEPSELIIAPDDRSILFQNDLDSQYYVFDINNTENTISIGRQLQSGGFNYLGNKIAFVNYDPADQNTTYPYLAIYSSDRKETVIPAIKEYAFDPKFFNKTDDVIFSERRRELEGTKGIFQIMKYSEADGKTLIIDSEDKSLEFPKVSPDDRYVLIEEFSTDQLQDYTKQRQFEFQTKPFSGTLMIYDLVKKEVVKNGIEGVNAAWDF